MPASVAASLRRNTGDDDSGGVWACILRRIPGPPRAADNQYQREERRDRQRVPEALESSHNQRQNRER